MKNLCRLLFGVVFITVASTHAAPQFGKILEGLGKKGTATTSSLGNDKIVSGLKEALEIGAKSAVALTGKTDGFNGNPAIRILMPAKLQSLEKGLRTMGLSKKVDEFELSMNRAAEKAAPEARNILVHAIQEMTLTDGKEILTGGDTAATEYFKTKTSASLTAAFKPIVEKAIEETGVTRQFQQLTGAIPANPFLKKESFDINSYVVTRSLDGLFHMLGEEERKIRTDPAARATTLLKEVFGHKGTP